MPEKVTRSLVLAMAPVLPCPALEIAYDFIPFRKSRIPVGGGGVFSEPMRVANAEKPLYVGLGGGVRKRLANMPNWLA